MAPLAYGRSRDEASGLSRSSPESRLVAQLDVAGQTVSDKARGRLGRSRNYKAVSSLPQRRLNHRPVSGSAEKLVACWLGVVKRTHPHT